jgi:hypothetical protein
LFQQIKEYLFAFGSGGGCGTLDVKWPKISVYKAHWAFYFFKKNKMLSVLDDKKHKLKFLLLQSRLRRLIQLFY